MCTIVLLTDMSLQYVRKKNQRIGVKWEDLKRERERERESMSHPTNLENAKNST